MRTLDVRGRSCPIPIVELMRVIKTLPEGDEVEVKADDKAFPADVEAWCKKTGNALVRLTMENSEHVALVRKA